MNHRKNPTVLFVEDDPTVRTSAVAFLEDHGYSVIEAVDGMQGLKLLHENIPDIILTDIRMPKMNGLDVLKSVTAEFPELPIIVVSGTGDLNDVVDALRFGVWDFIVKPILDMEILQHSIEKCLEKADLIKENRIHRERLEVANRELESFNYSVSHDLRSPLHAIDGFSSMLEEDYMQVLDDEGQDYLRRIRLAAKRMHQMIDDLLALSRISKHEINKSHVHLSGIVHNIVDILQVNEPNRHVNVDIDENVDILADEGLIRNVMENLIGNAWKYSSKTTNPSVQFGIEQTDKGPAIFVKDNGVGFNMKYAAKLFGAFQRLHSQDEFEGTGIGLATVRRIINRHGGSVWAMAEPDQGATFYFTLPSE